MDGAQADGTQGESGGAMKIFWMLVKIALLIFIVLWGINYFYKKNETRSVAEDSEEDQYDEEFEEKPKKVKKRKI